MEARALRFVAASCEGDLLAGLPAAMVSRVCTDSRQVEKGDLFFALVGERFDGHNFLPQLVGKAAAVVVERTKVPDPLPDCAVIAVQDTRLALGRLAQIYRKDFDPHVVAVGGSNGKTTTKELIASVLKQRFSTLASEASFNNEIGVPLTLLRLERGHQAAVLEAGTNHPGELAPLVRMIGPRYGIITSIGREHLEFFGDVTGVAHEQGWLAELLPHCGKLFLNGDSEWADVVARRARVGVVRVGLGERNEWRAVHLRPDKHGLSFRVNGPPAEFAGEYRVNLLGRHQASNALLAIAIGAELGLNRSEIEQGLAACRAPKMRLHLWESNGVKVLDDAYNANADSMEAALQTLQELPCRGRRVAVLGDMAELGSQSEAAHEEAGRRAAELGVGQLFAVGRMAPVLARGAREAGLTRVLEFADLEPAAAAVKQFLREGDLVLLKASRAARLERISERLRSGGSEEEPECSIT